MTGVVVDIKSKVTVAEKSRERRGRGIFHLRPAESKLLLSASNELCFYELHLPFFLLALAVNLQMRHYCVSISFIP